MMSSEEFEHPYFNGVEGYTYRPAVDERPASQRPLSGEVAEVTLSRSVLLKHGLMPSDDTIAREILAGAVSTIFEAEHVLRQHAGNIRRAYE